MQKGVNWCYNKLAKRCKLLYKQGDIMRRKYLNDLIEWMNDPRRKPLMVSGARQVGKSYLIEELFAKEYYKNKYLKIDLSDDVDFVEFAENNSNLEKVLEYIQLHYNFIPDENHLLIFDEAQECPSIVKMKRITCYCKWFFS